MKLRPLSAADQRTVRGWPPYPSEFADLDYALRADGWLDQFPAGPGNHRYGAWVDRDLVGFSILTETGPGEAEFFIALHPERLGQGIGRELTPLVLAEGFRALGLRRIHLKVRSWHTRGIHLYAQAGFREVGETEMEIRGKRERFVLMEARHP